MNIIYILIGILIAFVISIAFNISLYKIIKELCDVNNKLIDTIDEYTITNKNDIKDIKVDIHAINTLISALDIFIHNCDGNLHKSLTNDNDTITTSFDLIFKSLNIIKTTIDNNEITLEEFISNYKNDIVKVNVGVHTALTTNHNIINRKLEIIKDTINETVMKNDLHNAITGFNKKLLDNAHDIATVVANSDKEVIKKIEAKNSSINKLVKKGTIIVQNAEINNK